MLRSVTCEHQPVSVTLPVLATARIHTKYRKAPLVRNICETMPGVNNQLASAFSKNMTVTLELLLVISSKDTIKPVAIMIMHLMSTHHACSHDIYTTGHLSFHHMAQCVVHALKGLACHARATPARLTPPSLHARSCASPSRACKGHKPVLFFSMGPKLRHPAVLW